MSNNTVTVYRDRETGDIRFREAVEEEFMDLIDETSGTVEILGLTYNASTLFRDSDPIAFRVYLSDYASERYDELEIPWEVFVELDEDGIREFLEDNAEE